MVQYIAAGKTNMLNFEVLVTLKPGSRRVCNYCSLIL